MIRIRQDLGVLFLVGVILVMVLGCDSKSAPTAAPISPTSGKSDSSPSKEVTLAPTVVSQSKLPDDTLLASVGRFDIKASDLAYFAKLKKLYRPNAYVEPKLEELAQEFRWAVVAEQNGFSVTDDLLKKELESIEHKSTDAVHFSQIKEIFHGDDSAFLRLVALPSLVHRTLSSEIFPKSDSAQRPVREKAEQILKEAKKTPAKFESLVEKQQLTIQKIDFSKDGKIDKGDSKSKEGPKPPGADPSKGSLITVSSPEDQQKIFNASLAVSAGKMAESVVETSESFVVIRKEKSPSTKIVQLSAVALPKLTFAAWLRPQLEAITVKRAAVAK